MATKASEKSESVSSDQDAAPAEAASDSDVTRALTADNVIKDHVIASVAASIVPVPVFDIASVVAIQLRMIQKLSQLHGKPFSEGAARKVIFALAGGVMGYGAGAMVAASATKLIPGIGWMVGMVSLPVVAGASTYAVGRSILKHYEDGNSLFDFSVDKMRDYYKQQFEKGKAMATRAHDEAKDAADEPLSASA